MSSTRFSTGSTISCSINYNYNYLEYIEVVGDGSSGATGNLLTRGFVAYPTVNAPTTRVHPEYVFEIEVV